jgi:hypothetical protein
VPFVEKGASFLVDIFFLLLLPGFLSTLNKLGVLSIQAVASQAEAEFVISIIFRSG